jgi:hypothetical protein
MLVMGQLLTHDLLYPEMIWAALLHDMGKIDTTRLHEHKGVLVSPGHDKVSADKYLPGLRHLIPDHLDHSLIEWLIRQHMRVQKIDEMRPAKQDVLRNDRYFPWLLAFTEADDMVRLFDETSEAERNALIEDAKTWLITQ